jgi:YVTN family beta-propeller protein
LIDDLTLGAANPYGLTISPDGAALFISLRGSHQVMTVDVPGLHRIIDETPVEQRPALANDLTFLYRNGVKKRADVGGLGPTGLALFPDGKRLFVADYFSGAVSVVRTRDLKVTGSVPLGDPQEMTPARKGEFLFHDAKSCMQEWQSCSSCHLDGRADALMWDLLNDGLGNPKNAKSLVLSGVTPPVMAHGVRADMRTAVEAGFRYILFREPSNEMIDSVEAYINSLEPEPNPILSMGPERRASIERGRKLFDDPEVGCSKCHPRPLWTDLQITDVGTASKYDRGDGNFDTPTLVELYRTAPYLHDGTAVTLSDVLTTRNPEDKHGHTSKLSEEQIDDLVAFLLSL